MDKDQYKREMAQVGEADLGRQMINHTAKCHECRDKLMKAQQEVVNHLNQTGLY